MSFIIQGIDLPKEGSRMVEIYPDGTASADLGNFYPDMIEAIQIPKGHGRLKDEKDVRKVIRRFIGYLDQDMINRLIVKIDLDAPTILEAEGEE